jgi:hypothetical protein
MCSPIGHKSIAERVPTPQESKIKEQKLQKRTANLRGGASGHKEKERKKTHQYASNDADRSMSGLPLHYGPVCPAPERYTVM